MVHVSASLIRAHVSFEALARRWVKEVEAENEPLAEAEHDIEPSARKAGKIKKVGLTDHEASKATGARTRRLEPTHK